MILIPVILFIYFKWTNCLFIKILMTVVRPSESQSLRVWDKKIFRKMTFIWPIYDMRLIGYDQYNLCLSPSLLEHWPRPFQGYSLLRLGHHRHFHPFWQLWNSRFSGVAIKIRVLCVKLILYPIKNIWTKTRRMFDTSCNTMQI